MNRRRAAGIILICLGVGLVAVAGIKWKWGQKKLVSPLGQLATSDKRQATRNDGDKKIVMGFLPYWNIKYEPTIHYEKLTHLAFFGLNVNPNGSIQKREKQGNLDPGWRVYQSAKMGEVVRKAHDNGVKAILVLRAFDNETVESVLSSPIKQEKLIGETLETVKTKNLDGINIDFEYVGSPATSVKNQFTEFIKKFRSACDLSLVTCHLSIDMYADAATNDRLWDIGILEKVADYIVVMGYDFTRPSSEYSGPVAPLDQIKSAVAAYAEKVPTGKLILGVPYYGYQWPTYSQEPISKTTGIGSLASYRRIGELILGATIQLGWDEKSFTPYLISTESGKTTQVFYDDVRSLGLKYDLVNESGMAGVAIWALGYEGEHPELWELIREKFPLPF